MSGVKRFTIFFVVGLAAALCFFSATTKLWASRSVEEVLLQPGVLAKYVDPLPIPGAMPPVAPGGTYYEVGMWQIMHQFHSQLPAVPVWGYGPTAAAASYPGATFEAERGVPIQVKWTNNLPYTHLLDYAIDTTLHWADPEGPGIPAVAHLHGGETEPGSDGGPLSWFTQNFAEKGEDWQHEVFTYHNGQEPTTLWYHDHALGITRLNVYAGLAGFYLLRDPAFEGPLNLPSGAYEIPIVIQDRMLTENGELFYPYEGDNEEHPIWVPEFFGNVIVVNGKAWPYLNVEPRKYRFRFLNGSNARFYALRLLHRGSGQAGPAIYQIGSDGGYLETPVMLNNPNQPNGGRLLLAPGERADVIIDFSGLPVGTNLELVNNAKAPFPNGTAADPRTVGKIMQFRVVSLTGADESSLPMSLNNIPALTPGPVTRTLTLNEMEGPNGPLMALLDGKEFMADITEYPELGATELWEIVNTTGDAHPIHIHLVQFQMLNRQAFNAARYMYAYEEANPELPAEHTTVVPVGPYLQGTPVLPDSNERGWKDTFRMNPGEVSRVLVRFAPQDGISPFAFDATAEPGYVWHCHILEHEDNEMMRPYMVVAPQALAKAAGQEPVLGNYPNPFNPETQISFRLPNAGNVDLRVFNILGQEVRRLVSEEKQAGEHTIRWDGRDDRGALVASGIYFYRLETPEIKITKQMLFLK
ncbi:MAG TPA: multicopper oxidase domain-containing protein [candidate division Zixibacteria bacterium]|nr:multicopper oxidase domain-containing protein [candidate division Zixibacteria bacterium]